MTGLFWRGLALGFLVAAPVGPIGLLCLSRTLAGGWSRGFVSGLGAATADACYAGLAGLGVAVVSRFLNRYVLYFSLAGALWLGWLGLSTALPRTRLYPRPPRPTLSAPSRLATARGPRLRVGTPGPGAQNGGAPENPGLAPADARPIGLPAAYFSILGLTLTNPMTILFFAAAYSGLVRDSHPLFLAAGAFCGSTLWWLVLSGSAAALRTRLSATVLRRLNTASGLVILGFALAVLIRALG